MRPPYPTEVVPLLSQLLLRARAGLDLIQRVQDELGIDRPAVLHGSALVQLGERGGNALDIAGPYATKHDLGPALAAAAGAGLIEQREGRWYQTSKGRELAVRHREAAHALFAGRRTIDDAEVARLAELLERAFEASVAAREPAKDRVHRAKRGRVTEAIGPFAKLEDAVRGLWLFRDDCHIAAWRAAGQSGPVLDLLTRVWRDEATDAGALRAKVPQRGEDVDAGLARLRADGHLEPGDPLRLTPKGRAFRSHIEDETDRFFFTPWPDDVGAQGEWIRSRLEAVNSSLG